MAAREFSAKLLSEGPGGSWTYLEVPFRVEEVWGTRARVSVKGTINGFPYRNSAFPTRGGPHVMMVNRELQRGAGVKPGDTVHVTMEHDMLPRTVTVPADFKRALAKNKVAKAVYQQIAYSHKKEFVNWISQAKREETRARRIVKALQMLASKKMMD